MQFPNVTGKIPNYRSDHAACITGSYMYVFGGKDARINNDMFRLNLLTWAWTIESF